MMKQSKIFLCSLAGSALLSCAPCSFDGYMTETQAKQMLLRCRGNPLRIEFVDPGGPFFQKTEIWHYSSDEKSGRDQYWFANGKCISSPQESEGAPG